MQHVLIPLRSSDHPLVGTQSTRKFFAPMIGERREVGDIVYWNKGSAYQYMLLLCGLMTCSDFHHRYSRALEDHRSRMRKQREKTAKHREQLERKEKRRKVHDEKLKQKEEARKHREAARQLKATKKSQQAVPTVNNATTSKQQPGKFCRPIRPMDEDDEEIPPPVLKLKLKEESKTTNLAQDNQSKSASAFPFSRAKAVNNDRNVQKEPCARTPPIASTQTTPLPGTSGADSNANNNTKKRKRMELELKQIELERADIEHQRKALRIKMDMMELDEKES